MKWFRLILIGLFLVTINVGIVSAAKIDQELFQETLTGMIGNHVWYIKTSRCWENQPFVGEVGNLEELIIKEINFDNGFFVFEKTGGKTLVWEIFSKNEKRPPMEMFNKLLQSFLFKSPYKSHPELTSEIWGNIRRNSVEKGMTYEMVQFAKPSSRSSFEPASVGDTTVNFAEYACAGDVRGETILAKYTFKSGVLVNIEYELIHELPH